MVCFVFAVFLFVFQLDILTYFVGQFLLSPVVKL